MHGLNPLLDGAWARTCSYCGNGMNLKLDPATTNSSGCVCQQDSVCINDMLLPKPRQSPCTPPRSTTPSSHSNNSKQSPLLLRQHQKSPFPPPTPPPTLPAWMMIDRGRLVSTIYHSRPTFPARLEHKYGGKNDRFVLRYTDAGIQKPKSGKRINNKNSFPKLVSRYISTRGHNNSIDGPPTYIESYKQGGASKLAIVNHKMSFTWHS